MLFSRTSRESNQNWQQSFPGIINDNSIEKLRKYQNMHGTLLLL